MISCQNDFKSNIAIMHKQSIACNSLFVNSNKFISQGLKF
nr:MAG TPA: hypothetical protein [Caudoviricetes sp.]